MKKLKYIKPEAEVVHFHLMDRGSVHAVRRSKWQRDRRRQRPL